MRTVKPAPPPHLRQERFVAKAAAIANVVLVGGAIASAAALFFFLFTLIFGTPAAYPCFAGFIAGYLVYDYTHFHLHHHVPKTAAGKQLREQHMRHHFQDHRYGYGVSSPLWDIVFRTRSQKLTAD